MTAALGIYAKENGQGMMFDVEMTPPPDPTPPDDPSGKVKPLGRPSLKVVK